MLLTKYKNYLKYKNIIPGFDQIKDINLRKLDVGKHVINEKIFILILEKETQDNNIFECHKKYIDIHVLLEGSEKLFYTSNNYKIIQPYNDEEDVSLGFVPNGESSIVLLPNDAVLFFPGEPHSPLLHHKHKKIKKAIIKVLV